MASKSDAPAEVPEATEEQPAGPAAVEQQPEAVAEVAPAESEAEAPAAPADETADEVVDGLPEINAAVRAMKHPDGEASCDRYESDKHGNVLVPASEVPSMLEHGFVLVDDDA